MFKKRIITKKITACAIFSLLVLFSAQGPVRAMEISAGPVVWYAWWSPYFKNFFALRCPRKAMIYHVSQNVVPVESRWNESGAFLYGPLLSVKLSESWSLGSAFITSSPYNQSGGHTKLISGNSFRYKDISIKMRKYDSDTTITYAVLPYLKVFGGFKYQGYAYHSRRRATYAVDIASSSINPVTYGYKSDSDGYGAGLGLGVTLPIWEDLYVIGNFSGIYLNSSNAFMEKYLAANGSGALNRQNQHFYSWGMNGNLSLAYYIPAASITISAGFRFQILKMFCSRLVNSLYNNTSTLNEIIVLNRGLEYSSKDLFNKTVDYFYGAALAVTYNFKI